MSKPSFILNLRKDREHQCSSSQPCFLINDKSTRVGIQVSRNGAESAAHNLCLLMGIQKYEKVIVPSHRGKEAVTAVARENSSFIICFKLVSSR